MGNFWKKLGKALFFFFPLILGVAGLWAVAGEPLLDALFSCLLMYTLGYDQPAANGLVELARWLAPLSTASGIFLAVGSLREALRRRWRSWQRESVAVYGPAEERERLLARLGSRGIEGRNQVLPARQYILLGDGAESLELCSRIMRQKQGARVCLQCGALRGRQAADPRLTLFSPEEIAARLFWKEHCLYRRSVQRGHRMKLVLLGFGPLGESLLYYGLLDNIFHPDQRLEYHVFGGGERFAAVHSQLDQISDPVVLHPGPWWEELPLLEEAEQILVLPQEGQLSVLQDLLLAVRTPKITAFVEDGAAAGLLEGGDRLEAVTWRAPVWEPENILGDALFRRAKAINHRYACLYGGAEDTEAAREAEWNKLDAFTRCSNISAADYHEIRLTMLAEMGQPSQDLSPDCLELLAQLEHIRWCRFHYLENWRRGQPENGKRKDPVRRIHADLVPYEELTEGEKEKDRENIRVLMSVST